MVTVVEEIIIVTIQTDTVAKTSLQILKDFLLNLYSDEKL